MKKINREDLKNIIKELLRSVDEDVLFNEPTGIPGMQPNIQKRSDDKVITSIPTAMSHINDEIDEPVDTPDEYSIANLAHGCGCSGTSEEPPEEESSGLLTKILTMTGMQL